MKTLICLSLNTFFISNKFELKSLEKPDILWHRTCLKDSKKFYVYEEINRLRYFFIVVSFLH